MPRAACCCVSRAVFLSCALVCVIIFSADLQLGERAPPQPTERAARAQAACRRTGGAVTTVVGRGGGGGSAGQAGVVCLNALRSIVRAEQEELRDAITAGTERGDAARSALADGPAPRRLGALDARPAPGSTSVRQIVRLALEVRRPHDTTRSTVKKGVVWDRL